MPAKIFLCYRHDDSADAAIRVREALESRYERDLHFVGFESALGGKKFDESVRAEVSTCDAFIIFIGPSWSYANYDDGVSRAATPQNGTRVAVVTALEMEKPVLPVLLNGAHVPRLESLPEDMRPMAYRNAIALRDGESFQKDLDAFCKYIEGIGSAVLGKPVRKKGIGSGSMAGEKRPDCAFISYRRNDSAGNARQLFKHLRSRLGSERVFMDVDSIMQGTDFRSALDDYLDRSALVLALIGTRWLDPQSDGKPRLFEPSDFVRLELSTALRRDKPVIPVIIGDAVLPTQEQLPSDLKALPFRHAVFLKDTANFALRSSGLDGAITKYLTMRTPWWRKLLPWS